MSFRISFHPFSHSIVTSCDPFMVLLKLFYWKYTVTLRHEFHRLWHCEFQSEIPRMVPHWTKWKLGQKSQGNSLWNLYFNWPIEDLFYIDSVSKYIQLILYNFLSNIIVLVSRYILLLGPYFSYEPYDMEFINEIIWRLVIYRHMILAKLEVNLNRFWTMLWVQTILEIG